MTKIAAFLTLLLLSPPLRAGTVALFVNLDVPPGVILLGMPFVNGNNMISDVFQNLPIGTEVYKWEGDHFTTNAMAEFGWTISNQKILPGEAVFVHNNLSSTLPLTLAGEFESGTTVTNQIPAGLSAISAPAPAFGKATTDLNLRLSAFDNLYIWQTNRFAIFTFLSTGKWFPYEPRLTVGQGFFVRASAPTNWVLSAQ